VDGNDLVACYVATREAIDRARRGEGPTLIEALTYRLSLHTTSDDPTKYRDEAEVKAWEAREPLPRFRRYLEAKGLLDAASEAALEAEVDAEVRGAVERAEARMQANLLDAFEQVYAEPTEELRAQRAELERELAESAEAAQGSRA
jgi:pyruvate dehydrogenase E1 component alpha subunit